MPYNQFSAMLAIAKGSFKAILRSPSTVAFSIGFPFLFIIGFPFINKQNDLRIKVGYNAADDTTSAVFKRILGAPGIQLKVLPEEDIQEELKKNRIAAWLTVSKNNSVSLVSPQFADPAELNILQTLLQASLGTKYMQDQATPVVKTRTLQIKQYKKIDFLLPGILGFALLGTSVFSVAFLFFNLRQQLVLKRFFATPISKINILLGETMSQAIFQLISTTIILLAGIWLYQFTLAHGLFSFIQIMIVGLLTLVVFMAGGFVVSGIANSSGSVPALANIFTVPQFLLSGSFFPIENFPQWMQPFCKMLPLTHFNEALRRISFDGATLYDCWLNLTTIIIWGIFLYLLALKFFKWE